VRITDRSAHTGQRLYLVVFAVLLILEGSLSGQHLYQQPKPLQPKAELENIIGQVSSDKTGRELNVLWVYGYDEHHIAGAHDYVKVKDLMINLLSGVQGINVEEVFLFPSEDQFNNAAPHHQIEASRIQHTNHDRQQNFHDQSSSARTKMIFNTTPSTTK